MSIVFLLLPIVLSIECNRVTQPKDIPCMIISSWKPSAGCSENLTIYMENGTESQVLEWGDLNAFCNATFNVSTEGTWIYNSSIEDGIIEIKSEDNMTSLGIIIFLLTLNIALFIAPFKISFSQNNPTDFVIKNMVWILAWVILTFNTTILATLAENAGLGITRELFVFQWFFLKGIYILAIIIFLRTMLSSSLVCIA